MEVLDNNAVGFCRGCLTSGIDMKSLFVEPYQQHFTDLTNIKISDDDILSSWLCTGCYMIMLRLKRFIDKVKMIDTVLKNHSINSKLNIDQLTEISYKYNDIKPNISLRETCLLQACSNCCKSDVMNSDKDIAEFTTQSSKIKYINDKCYHLNNKVFHFEEVDVSQDNFESNVNEGVASNDIPKIEKYECIQEIERAGKTNENFSYVDNFIDISKLRKEEEFENSSTSTIHCADEVCDSDEFLVTKKHKNKKKKIKKPKRTLLLNVLQDMANTRFTIIELTPEEQLKELNDRRTSKSYFNARYKCELCIKVFPYEESLRNHLSRHDQSYGNCECDICHQRFNNKRILKNHCGTHSRRYQCRICNRQLHFKTTMAHHLLRHDNTYICRICGHHSTDKNGNRLHQKEHMSSNTFSCSTCPKTFNNKHDFGVHIRRHTGDMPFVCNKCNKCFQTIAALEAHKAVHSSARGFYCAECDVSFKTRDTMLTHFKKSVKHIDPALLNFSCTMCTKKFESKIQLAAHVDNYHLRRAKMSCDICPAQFVSSNGLRNHKLRKHEGLRPPLSHVCETCGRGFTTKALVTNHLRTHTGEQPFECETCHRRFSQKSAMQTHIKLVHLKIKRTVNRINAKPRAKQIKNPEEWSDHL